MDHDTTRFANDVADLYRHKIISFAHSLSSLDGSPAAGVEYERWGQGAALELVVVLADNFFFCRSTAGTDNAFEKEKRGQGSGLIRREAHGARERGSGGVVCGRRVAGWACNLKWIGCY